MMEVIIYLSFVAKLITVLTALLAFIYYKKLRGEMKVLAWFAFINLGFEITTTMIANYGIQNLFITHFYAIIGFTVLALMFAEATQTYISKRVYHYSIVIFLIFSIINILFITPLQSFNKLGRALEAFIAIGFCFVYFFQLLDQLKVEKLYKEPFFWVAISTFFYYTASFIASLMMFVKMSPEYFAITFGIVMILTSVKYLCYCVAFVLAAQLFKEGKINPESAQVQDKDYDFNKN